MLRQNIAVAVDDRFERVRYADEGPGNADHRVVDVVVVEKSVAAVFREERAIPVGNHVPGMDTHCVQ